MHRIFYFNFEVSLLVDNNKVIEILQLLFTHLALDGENGAAFLQLPVLLRLLVDLLVRVAHHRDEKVEEEDGDDDDVRDQ